jgi:hypothetical protein
MRNTKIPAAWQQLSVRRNISFTVRQGTRAAWREHWYVNIYISEYLSMCNTVYLHLCACVIESCVHVYKNVAHYTSPYEFHC